MSKQKILQFQFNIFIFFCVFLLVFKGRCDVVERHSRHEDEMKDLSKCCMNIKTSHRFTIFFSSSSSIIICDFHENYEQMKN